MIVTPRWWTLYFYPRPPRGGRHCTACLKVVRKKFLSTPSARRATGEVCRLCMRFAISIHALREEGDVQRQYVYQEFRDFYPRPPRGGRRGGSQQHSSSYSISIHALREEGDQSVPERRKH